MVKRSWEFRVHVAFHRQWFRGCDWSSFDEPSRRGLAARVAWTMAAGFSTYWGDQAPSLRVYLVRHGESANNVRAWGRRRNRAEDSAP